MRKGSVSKFIKVSICLSRVNIPEEKVDVVWTSGKVILSKSNNISRQEMEFKNLPEAYKLVDSILKRNNIKMIEKI